MTDYTANFCSALTSLVHSQLAHNDNISLNQKATTTFQQHQQGGDSENVSFESLSYSYENLPSNTTTTTNPNISNNNSNTTSQFLNPSSRSIATASTLLRRLGKEEVSFYLKKQQTSTSGNDIQVALFLDDDSLRTMVVEICCGMSCQNNFVASNCDVILKSVCKRCIEQLLHQECLQVADSYFSVLEKVVENVSRDDDYLIFASSSSSTSNPSTINNTNTNNSNLSHLDVFNAEQEIHDAKRKIIKILRQRKKECETQILRLLKSYAEFPNLQEVLDEFEPLPLVDLSVAGERNSSSNSSSNNNADSSILSWYTFRFSETSTVPQNQNNNTSTVAVSNSPTTNGNTNQRGIFFQRGSGALLIEAAAAASSTTSKPILTVALHSSSALLRSAASSKTNFHRNSSGENENDNNNNNNNNQRNIEAVYCLPEKHLEERQLFSWIRRNSDQFINRTRELLNRSIYASARHIFVSSFFLSSDFYQMVKK